MSRARVGVIAGLTALVVVLWGGYGHHWSWTGINGSTATLWDWLHLLLLPLAVGVLPIWLSRKTRLTMHHKLLGVAVAVWLAVLIVVGYAVPWAWTGFSGNTLWDWLELLALPLAVALAPTLYELRSVWGRRQTLIALMALAVFLAIVVGGYLGHWAWTGFRGNTLWDWLHLLLLPLLLPTIVVPALLPLATAGILIEETTAERPGAPSAANETSPAPTAAPETSDPAPPQFPPRPDSVHAETS